MKVLFIVCCVYAFVSFPLNASKQPHFGEIFEIEGSVKVYRKLRFLPVALKKELLHLDKVRTAKASTLSIDTYEGSQLIVSPETRMTLTRADVRSPKKINIQLISGIIRCKVHKLSKNESFRIKTPVAVVGVRGTDFVTSYSRLGGLKVTVLEGEVEVKALKEIQGKARSQTMNINEQIRMNDNFDFIDRRSLSPTEMKTIRLNYSQKRAGASTGTSAEVQGEGESEEEERSGDRGGTVRVRRLKQTMKTITSQTQQNIFRDTNNQAQRDAKESALRIQFNLANP